MREGLHEPPADVVAAFCAASPALRAALVEDAHAIYEGDPAATDVDEVIRVYPGFLAIAIYRVAHHFHTAGVPVLPRTLTENAHARTGIDIHPAARIGRSFCIDHGTGIASQYVFPDHELIPVGDAIACAELCGLELRDVENLREHCARVCDVRASAHASTVSEPRSSSHR